MIAGENGPCVDVASVSLCDARSYCVKVTRALTSVTHCAPLFLSTLTTATGPFDQTACPGSTLNLCTDPCGVGPFKIGRASCRERMLSRLGCGSSIANARLSGAGTYCV